MPDHEHTEGLELYHDVVDIQTLAEHLSHVHGWEADDCDINDLLRVHRRRHNPGEWD